MSQFPKSSIHPAAGHESAKIRFWGVRGSIPVSGPQTMRFGGNTSCVEVRADGQIIILDAGSGLRPLGVALGSEFRVHPLDLTILITHTHWDHIQGFPFFAPAYDARNRIRICGSSGTPSGLRDALTAQMETPYFPVTMSQLSAGIIFDDLRDGMGQIGNIRVSACRTNHQGVCHGYRLDTTAGSICYIPDHEAGGKDGAPRTAAVMQLIHEADLVILDSQYTAEEYRGREGWGHSSMEDAIRIARDARAKRLHLFHHDPSHDDDFVDQMLQKARRIAMGSGMRVEAAREGEQVTLVAKGWPQASPGVARAD
jgi:phosphoribosyl 1,2-cyclic phosphodiesterase